MKAYYNEVEPFAVNWLRNLIAGGHLPDGEVDSRPIQEVMPEDLAGFDQCHFFAGIGVWPYALERAGWPDDVKVWTGSCPCQPFSVAGRQDGVKDQRHLWPVWKELIDAGQPTVVFGEQVASPLGRSWFDCLQTNLETLGFEVGAADLCAAGVGAPHIRQRLFFVASPSGGVGDPSPQRGRWNTGEVLGTQGGSQGEGKAVGSEPDVAEPASQGSGEGFGVGNPNGTGPQGRSQRGNGTDQRPLGATGMAGGWRDPVWIPCSDGKYRPTKPGLFPLAHGTTKRVGRLRGYGNAIVAPVAQVFIEAFMDTGRI